jgi:hypothetical protein
MADGKTARADTAEVAGALGDGHRVPLAMLGALLCGGHSAPQRPSGSRNPSGGARRPPGTPRPEARGRGCPAGPPKMAGRGNYLRRLWDIESTAVVHGADMG